MPHRSLKTAILAVAMLSGSAATAQNAPKPAPGPYVLTTEDRTILNRMFDDVDINRDGDITKVELSAFGVRHGLGPIVKNKEWRDRDANRDGRITRAELFKAAARYQRDKNAR